MANPKQYGQNAIWDGPLSEAGRSLAPGNSRNHMQILKSPCKYSPGPITMKSYKDQGGNWPESMEGEVYNNPTAK